MNQGQGLKIIKKTQEKFTCRSINKMELKTFTLAFMIAACLSSTTGKAIINGTAKLEKGPQDQNAKIGQNVTLQCQWSKTSSDCYWMKDDFSVIMSENERYTLLSGDNKTKICSLEITGLQPADEGNWQCVFSKEQNTSTSKLVKLIVDDTDVRHLMAFEVSPKDTTVINGKDVTLECKFTTAAPLCFWGKDGELMAIRGRYHYIGDKFKGNCSIRISKANLLDDGLWLCGYPRSDTEPMLKSPTANLSVYVTPSEPVIVVNGIPIEPNEKLFISTLNRPPKISCWSENGKPATDMRWTLPSDGLLPPSLYIIPYEPPLISDSVKYSLKISELPFRPDFKQQWQQLNLTCVAAHPSYDKNHNTSVHLILGSEIITTTTPASTTTTTKSYQCIRYGYNC